MPLQSPVWFQGILSGLVLAFMLGPAFFVLLRTSIVRGFGAGASFAMGIVLSDAVILCSVTWGLSQFYTLPIFQEIFALIGGAVLLVYGLYLVHKKDLHPVQHQPKESPVPRHDWRYMVKGFLLNVISPSAFVLWTGLVGSLHLETEVSGTAKWSFIIAVLATVFATDLLKAYLAQQIRDRLRPALMRWLNIGIGVVLLGLGISLLGSTIP